MVKMRGSCWRKLGVFKYVSRRGLFYECRMQTTFQKLLKAVAVGANICWRKVGVGASSVWARYRMFSNFVVGSNTIMND